MENYEKFMIEKGKEQLDYNKIINDYTKTINLIYREIETENPTQYNTQTHRPDYSNEYVDVYNYFQKVEWRLNDIKQLLKYQNQPDFKYFAIENLYNARNRITEYLNNTENNFPLEVYNYTEYNTTLDELYLLLKEDKEYNQAFEKYNTLIYMESEIHHIEVYINSIKNYTGFLKDALTKQKPQYIETENLLETVKLLEKIEKDLIIKPKNR